MLITYVLKSNLRFWLKMLICGFFHSFHFHDETLHNNFSYHFLVKNNYFWKDKIWQILWLFISMYFFRYIYIIAATSDTNFGRLAKWLTMNSNFHIHLTVLGLMMTAFHGLSTIFLSSDQFFFDQGTKRMNIFNTEKTRKVDFLFHFSCQNYCAENR